MAVRIVVHGHFYQPPRENPWTGEIDRQVDAAPFPDFNEKVHAEAYQPNAFARLGDGEVNNFARMSFDIGPTLLAWLERFKPDTYARILAADLEAMSRVGYGNAMAQAFHHTILPLSGMRDVHTQIRWGIGDFTNRFQRYPDGMWLPEAATNAAVLGALIDDGISFTLLAQHQAAQWQDAAGVWHDGADDPIDPTVPYLFEHPDGSGRALALFFFDAGLSRAIAFDNLAASSAAFVDAFVTAAPGDDSLVHAATDGETYGHHHRFAEMGLAHALFAEAPDRGIEVLNYAAVLASDPPTRKVRIVGGEGSSWSCSHGVGRWMRDCGCFTYGPEGATQEWRAPLRAGLEVIRWAVDETYELYGKAIFVDPWGARDRYVDVVVGRIDLESFLEGETAGMADPDSLRRAALLLELQRNSMQMFTSCGWFFYDVARVESVQILRYAARTLELLEQLGLPLPDEAYIPLLSEARSNDPKEGTAASILYEIRADPTRQGRT